MRIYFVCKIGSAFGSGITYHWNVAGAVAGLDPLFVQKMPVWKRMIDIIVATVGIVLISPLFLLFSAFIKTVSPGPIFFKQERVGYGGRVFTMLKLRTMQHNSDPSIHRNYLSKLIHADENSNGNPLNGVMKKLENDSRIIPLGKFLRSTGMDELPQLMNVLSGDMSLVGPRPPIPYEVDEYKSWFNNRFDIVPGLTGLWQVSGKNKLTFLEMIRLDIKYIRNQSFWTDLKIILLTPMAILHIVRDKKG